MAMVVRNSLAPQRALLAERRRMDYLGRIRSRTHKAMSAASTVHPYRRFSLAERDRRWAAVRALMRRDGIAAIVAPQNPGNSTDWQADARYLSHCGGGADASIGVVFPLEGDVT